MRKEIETKKEKKFSDEIRFCVMELAALEVATAKMEAVMGTVGELCGVRYKCLPNKTACQSMIDKGQLAKRFIREKVFFKVQKLWHAQEWNQKEGEHFGYVSEN